MTCYEIADELRRLASELPDVCHNEPTTLLEFAIRLLDQHNAEIHSELTKQLLFGPPPKAADKVIALLALVSTRAQEFQKAVKIGILIDDLRDAQNRISAHQPRTMWLQQLADNLNIFEDNLEHFFSDSSNSEARPRYIALTETGAALKATLTSSTFLLDQTLALLDGATSLGTQAVDEERCTFYLPHEVSSLNDFLDRLSALKSIIHIVAELKGKPHQSDPRIIKIESGSILAAILAHKEIILGFLTMTTIFVKLYADHHSKRGKLETHLKAIEAVKQQIDLRAMAQNSGRSHAEVQILADKLVDQLEEHLSTLLSDSPSVTINQTTLSLMSDPQKLLPKSETKTLPPSNNHNLPTNDSDKSSSP